MLSLSHTHTHSHSHKHTHSQTHPHALLVHTYRASFIKEMRTLSKLRHPCVTTVMGAVMINGWEPMMVMEHMDLGSLYNILHNETMELDGEARYYLTTDIVSGCRFLHSSDPPLIHGDLKSLNVLVDSKFRAKVCTKAESV